MMAIKLQVGVSLEINLRNPSHAGNETHKQGIHHGFEKRKQGTSILTKKTMNSGHGTQDIDHAGKIIHKSLP